MNPTENADTGDTLRETLTAYLDGELNEAEHRRVEELLARDEAARLELRKLERVWDALDELPRAEVDTRFAQSTVEMVAQAAEEESRDEREAEPRRRRRFRLVVGASFVGSLLCGYAISDYVAARRDDQLARDLPLLENLDAYRQIRDIEFLDLLCEKRVFAVGPPRMVESEFSSSEEAWPTGSGGTLADHREQIAGMNDAQRDELARTLERFEALDEEEQERLRVLRRMIELSPRAAEMEQTARRYYEWLATLTPGKRAEIQALPPAERVAAVRQEREEQARRSRTHLSLQDYLALADWLQVQFEDRILAQVDDEGRREHFRNLPPRSRRAVIVGIVAWQMRDDNGPGPRDTSISDEAFDQLAEKLSPEARQQLDVQDTADGKRRVVARWLRDLAMRMYRRELDLFLEDISEEELTEFFQTLSDEEREELLSQSPNEMWHELRQEYVRSKIPVPEWRPGRSFRRPSDRGDGPPGGPPDGRPGSRPGERFEGPPGDRSGRPGPRREGFERRPPSSGDREPG